MDDLLARLHARIDRHSPARVLVVVRGQARARWLQRLLIERAALVGARVLEPEALLAEAMQELAGPPLPSLFVLEQVRRSLDAELQALADHPGYQRELLGAFVELERVLALGELDLDGLLALAEPDSRDRALLDAFARFRAAVGEAATARGFGWWRGQALARVLAEHARVGFLRRRGAAIAIGFDHAAGFDHGANSDHAAVPVWEQRLIAALGCESWPLTLPREHVGEARAALALRLECAAPEVEIAVIARMIRQDAEPTALLAPPDMLARWAQRLRHRDVPVRGFVDRSARISSVARALRALLRVAEQPLARRDDLDLLAFGPALRPWSDDADMVALRRAWSKQRFAAIGLAALQARLEQSEDTHDATLAEFVARLARWQAEPSASELRALLDDWHAHARAAAHGAGVERSAARAIDEQLERLEDEPAAISLAALNIALDHALALAHAGEWIEQRSESDARAPVWLLPYDALLDRLPARVFLTGLDRHPAPRIHAPLSDALRERIGLVGEARRFAAELRMLDAIVESAPGRVIASHRRGDGAGHELPPGPWIAGRQDEREQGKGVRFGVDAIALPLAGRGEPASVRPLAAIEQVLLDPGGELARRVDAIRTHEAPLVGPHTGLLGVAIPPATYSATTLQSYAALPFRYFVERVLGLGQREVAEPGEEGLRASEQGQVVHRAIDRALAQRLATTSAPLETASIAEPLLHEALAALEQGYAQRAAQGQSEAIWASERDRWRDELSAWWMAWYERLRRAWGGGDPQQSREVDEQVPGPFVLASEWSPPPGFRLELGPRSIAISAAIDRVELDPARQRVNVCDYKTGAPTWPGALLADLRAGTHLQLGLYALIVEQVLRSEPAALRLGELRIPVSVGAMRLEFLKRPPPQPGRLAQHAVVGVAPTMPLGLDARGNVWTLVQATAGFALAFVTAIEAGYFPVVSRSSARRRLPRSAKRILEVARVVPSHEQRTTMLPGALVPVPGRRGGER